MTVIADQKQLSDETETVDEKRGTTPTLLIDYKKYESMLDESDLSEDQKREFLETLWSVIVGFVDLGFGVHPLQQCGDGDCEQHLDLSSLMADDVVSSFKGIPKYEFTEAADRPTDAHAERKES
ncbi:hypothetical protein ACFQ14_12635 [Pseudahrensia aquimaris]|uniref:Uncharacterized protein n=1 Tax=Pseudahrensia aquimaris TaxID=744461 RepID=A0ABW3FFK3_9HYPH